MITGYLDEVFIKAITDTGIDMVFIVRNLPKKLIYREVPKMVTRIDRDGYTDGTQAVDPTGEQTDALLEGLEYSQTDDGSILFFLGKDPGKVALQTIDRYIASTLPRDVAIPERVPYPLEPGEPRSAPKPRNLIPAIDLPKQETDILVESKEVSPVAKVTPPKSTRTLKSVQKLTRGEILAKARATKAAKKNQTLV